MRFAALVLALPFFAPAQTRPLRPPEQPNPKTLIPQSTIESIVAEISGTRAMNSIYDLGGYEHDRLREEYQTTYREAAYMEKMAKQYGLEDVHIERFKMPAKTWDGELGELWLLTPQKRLIVSYRDITASLAPGSHSGDVTSELIYRKPRRQGQRLCRVRTSRGSWCWRAVRPTLCIIWQCESIRRGEFSPLRTTPAGRSTGLTRSPGIIWAAAAAGAEARRR